MFVKTAMIVLCTAGTVFYLRFLVALCLESKPRSTGDWLRLRIGSGEATIAERPERKKQVTRAA